MRATCPAHLILLDLIILIILGESTSYKSPHYAVFSNLLSLHPLYVYINEICPVCVQPYILMPLLSSCRLQRFRWPTYGLRSPSEPQVWQSNGTEGLVRPSSNSSCFQMFRPFRPQCHHVHIRRGKYLLGSLLVLELYLG
jgi:hypothetical protein